MQVGARPHCICKLRMTPSKTTTETTKIKRLLCSYKKLWCYQPTTTSLKADCFEMFNNHFYGRIFGFNDTLHFQCDIVSPPYSPNLKSSDFSIWGKMQSIAGKFYDYSLPVICHYNFCEQAAQRRILRYNGINSELALCNHLGRR